MSVTADWSLWTSSAPSEYFTWIKQQLRDQYTVTSQGDRNLLMTRWLSGDVYTLQFTLTPDAQGNDIRVEFHATPD